VCIILLMTPAYDVLAKKVAILKACKEVRGSWMLGVNRTRRHMALVHDEGDKMTACKHARKIRFVLSAYFSCRCHLSSRYRDKILVRGGNFTSFHNRRWRRLDRTHTNDNRPRSKNIKLTVHTRDTKYP